MAFPGQLYVGLMDLLLRRCRGNAQQQIVTPWLYISIEACSSIDRNVLSFLLLFLMLLWLPLFLMLLPVLRLRRLRLILLLLS